MSASPDPYPIVPAAVTRPFTRLPVTLVPSPKLMRYYALTSLMAGPGFPILLLVLYFRFRSLRYDVDDEGITMRWGILFRREISLTFSRIQDIHLSSNLVERWLGLAKIQVQTASGSASAEMTVEGLTAFEAMRDFLYGRMRGARDRAAHPAVGHGHAPHALAAGAAQADAGELAEVLREIAAEVRQIRASLAAPAAAEVDDA
jgi:membrane protein YdbS with pleckstrin-like domain